MRTRTALLLYSLIAVIGYGAYRYRVYEYQQSKEQDRVVIRSHSATLYLQGTDAGEYGHFLIINLSSRVKVAPYPSRSTISPISQT